MTFTWGVKTICVLGGTYVRFYFNYTLGAGHNISPAPLPPQGTSHLNKHMPDKEKFTGTGNRPPAGWDGRPEEGFREARLRDGEAYHPGSGAFNHLLMVNAGCLRVSCNESIGTLVEAGGCVLLPIGADSSCTALSDCTLVSFTFYTLPRIYFRDGYIDVLCHEAARKRYAFAPLPLRESLRNFLRLVSAYCGMGVDDPAMQEIKAREFFIVLQLSYTAAEVAALLHPLIGLQPSFRCEVLRQYRKASHVRDLAVSLGLEPRTFDRHFQEEFGMPPYQWMLRQRARHVYFNLVETAKPLEAIRKQHGFKFAGHFTRFVREQFNDTPLRIRNRGKLEVDSR